MNVLVISAGEPAVEWLALAISIRGHTPLRATDGAAALARLAQQPCQLVIIDHIEGGDDERLELCRLLRALPEMRATPIWVTADADEPAGIVRAIDAGATSYLTRPYDARQLRARFEHLERALAPDTPLPATAPTDIEQLLEALPDVVAIVDPTGQLLLITSGVRTLLGFSDTELTGENIEALCHPDDVPILLRQLRAAARPAVPAPIGVRLQRASGGWQPVDLYCRDLRALPAVGGLLLILRAGSSPQPRQQPLQQTTLADPQTGLAGSALFSAHLSHALARGERLNRPVAVIRLEIAINNDVALAQIAALIQRSIRAADIAARLDDATFAILVEDLENDEAEQVLAQRIQRAVTATGTASVGVARSQPGLTSASDLLRDAGRALRQSNQPPANPPPPASPNTPAAVSEPEPPQPPAPVQRNPERPVERSQPDPGLLQARVQPFEEQLAVIDRFRALEDHLAQLLNNTTD